MALGFSTAVPDDDVEQTSSNSQGKGCPEWNLMLSDLQGERTRF